VRAAGRPRAGPRASQASNPEIAPAKPALESGRGPRRPPPRPTPQETRRAAPPAVRTPPEDMDQLFDASISSHRNIEAGARTRRSHRASPSRRASPARKAVDCGPLPIGSFERQPCLPKRVVGGRCRSGPSRLRRTHRECSSRALRNAPDCWSSPGVLPWTRGQERAPLEHGMRSPGEPGNFAFLEGARTPYTCRVRPGRGDGTEGGEAWPKGVRSPRTGVNARRPTDRDRREQGRREQGRRERPEQRIENWT
jgi:hypothetical protein